MKKATFLIIFVFLAGFVFGAGVAHACDEVIVEYMAKLTLSDRLFYVGETGIGTLTEDQIGKNYRIYYIGKPEDALKRLLDYASRSDVKKQVAEDAIAFEKDIKKTLYDSEKAKGESDITGTTTAIEKAFKEVMEKLWDSCKKNHDIKSDKFQKKIGKKIKDRADELTDQYRTDLAGSMMHRNLDRLNNIMDELKKLPNQ